MQGYSYFPSIVYREEIPDLVGKSLEKTAKYYEEVCESQKDWAVAQTNNMVFDADLKYLADLFRSKAVEILNNQGYNLETFKPRVSAMWGQKFYKGGGNLPHVHPNSYICGVYFLDCPPTGAYPIFEDPRPAKIMSDLPMASTIEIKPCTPSIHFDNVIAGTFLFFNSWLTHRVSQNMNVQPTQLIHFILTSE